MPHDGSKGPSDMERMRLRQETVGGDATRREQGTVRHGADEAETRANNKQQTIALNSSGDPTSRAVTARMPSWDQSRCITQHTFFISPMRSINVDDSDC